MYPCMCMSLSPCIRDTGHRWKRGEIESRTVRQFSPTPLLRASTARTYMYIPGQRLRASVPLPYATPLHDLAIDCRHRRERQGPVRAAMCSDAARHRGFNVWGRRHPAPWRPPASYPRYAPPTRQHARSSRIRKSETPIPLRCTWHELAVCIGLCVGLFPR